MNEQTKSQQLGARLGKFVVQWRWIMLFVSIVLAGLVGSGAQYIAFDQDYKVFFDDDNPQLNAFEKIQKKYTKSDTIFAVVVPKDGADVFSPEVLAGIEEFTEEAWKLPYSKRVDSITNYQHTYAEEDDLIVSNLIEDAKNLSPQAIAEARNIALQEPTLVNRIFAPNGGATGINITFEMPRASLDETPQAVAAARALEAEIETKYPVDVHLGGIVMLNNSFFESSINDMSTPVPIMYLIIIFVTFFLVRSVSATIGVVLVFLMSVTVGMGAAGWLGIFLTPPSSAAPTIIMTLAVADSIHVIMTIVHAMRNGAKKDDAIIESLRLNLQPVFLTSITTAVGFLSLNFSDAQPFRDLGNIAAMGVMAAFFFSIIFLPAFLSVVPMKARSKESNIDVSLNKLGIFVTENRGKVLLGSALVSMLFISFIPSNRLNDDFVNYFDKSMDFRQATDITTEKLTGVYLLQFDLPSGEPQGVHNPEFLNEVENFALWLRGQPEVMHVDSLTDTFKRLNKNLHGDDPAFYRLPEDKEEAAQYLLLYELSLPYGLDTNNQIDFEKSSTQIRATLNNLPSGDMLAITQRSEQWLEDNTSIKALGVGPAIMFAYISENNIKSMIVGTLVAIVIIALIIMAALKSFKIGLLSLVPNLVPAGIAFGIWGIVVGEVNVAVSMVMGMTLGIVVDDTVHFLSKYLRGKREQGKDSAEAIQYAFREVGTAILVTSFILVAGFSMLAQSSFAMNSNMAALTAIAIAAAVVADFLLLPTLLLALDKGKEEKLANVEAVA